VQPTFDGFHCQTFYPPSRTVRFPMPSGTKDSSFFSTPVSSSITPEHGPIRHSYFSAMYCMASDLRSGPLTTSVSVSRKAKVRLPCFQCNHVIPEPVCSPTFNTIHIALLLSDHGQPWPYKPRRCGLILSLRRFLAYSIISLLRTPHQIRPPSPGSLCD
jgi:hypothetical protein